MPRGAHLTQRAPHSLLPGSLAGVALAVVLVGCGDGKLEVSPPRPSGPAATQCSALVADLPETVAGQRSRDISPRSGFTAAWGDPAIVLRCGGPAPAAIRATSQCFVVDGVGWLVTQHGREVDPTSALTGTLDFTTIDRSVYVDLQVPDKYQPAADALVDLAGTISRHTQQHKPCR